MNESENPYKTFFVVGKRGAGKAAKLEELAERMIQTTCEHQELLAAGIDIDKYKRRTKLWKCNKCGILFTIEKLVPHYS